MFEPQRRFPEAKEFEEKVIQIARVSKKTKGGNQSGFSILMVVGDKKGKVGFGLGKAGDVLSAIKKGIKKAKKHMITVPLDGTTIPFKMEVKEGAGRVLLKPAPKGTGVIAGGPVRAVVEAAGIRDISAKILGTTNQTSNVYATFKALQAMQRLVLIRGIKLRSIVDIEKEEKEKMKKLQEKAKAQTKEQIQPVEVPKKASKKVKPKQK
jgi:small subunit ribosomal protein S5